MNTLSSPNCLRDLSETICLIALNPENWDLDDKGNLINSCKSNLRNLSEIFSLVVNQFKQFQGGGQQPSKDALNCLHGLHVIAEHEKTGAALKIVESLSSARFKHSGNSEGTVTELDARRCQMILSALWLERDMVEKELVSFSFRRRLKDIQQRLSGPQPATGQDHGEECNYLNISKNVSGYLVSTIIKHSNRADDDGLGRSSDVQVRAICKELESLQAQGLLNDYDLEYLEKIELIVKTYDYNELISKIRISEGLQGLYFLNQNTELTHVLGEAPTGTRVIDCISKHIKASDDGSGGLVEKDGIEAIQDSIFNYLNHQLAAERRYRIVYQRLREKTKSLSHIHFRKLIHDGEKPLVAPDKFTYTWTLAKPKRQIPKTSQSKRNKGTSKKLRKVQLTSVQTNDAQSDSKAAVIPKFISQNVSDNLPLPSKLAPVVEDSKCQKEIASESFEYAKRVMKFLDSRLEPLTSDAVEHGFALAVDAYVKKLGIRTQWKEQDILYSIPGEIEYMGAVHRGIYTYCFEGNNPNRCYHRCFMRKPADQMVFEYSKKGYWEFDFPELGMHKMSKKKSGSLLADGSRVIMENQHVVEVSDPRNEAVIRLFKVK